MKTLFAKPLTPKNQDIVFGPDEGLVLQFKDALKPTTAIVFGAVPVPEDTILGHLAAPMPRIGGRISGHVPLLVVVGRASGTMPKLSGSARAIYSNDVLRGPMRKCRQAWQLGEAVDRRIAFEILTARAAAAEQSSHWQDARPCGVPVSARFATLAGRSSETAGRWQGTAPLSARRRTPWQSMTPQDAAAVGRWQEAQGISAAMASGWEDLIPARRFGKADWQDARDLGIQVLDRSGAGLDRSFLRRHIWQDAIWPRPGISRRPAVPDPHHFPVTTDLLFREKWTGTTAILFGAPHSDCIEIPILRTYIVLNDVSLRRVSDGKEFEATALSLSIDYQSWVWGFSASLPGSAFEDLAPAGKGLVELEASVNGVAWRVLVESRNREREFGKRSVSISGRGSAMLLSDTVAPAITLANSETRTAQQLANEALAPNGVPLGWELDWQIDDWAVPAGCWSYQGAPIGAITRIAEAAGAYVQADPSAKRLSVLAKYPVAPWAWASKAPDVILPIDICETDSVEDTAAAACNGVYVCGTTAGPLARVYRSGTAGDVLAPQVSDALITDAIVARMRGIAVLGAAGRKRTVTRSLPIMAPAGLIRVGKFLRVDSEAESVIGIVRGVSAIYSDKSVVRQSLEIESNA